ncbi:hypothetical protein REISMN_08340 (plasmid) [Rickettsia tamurae subsp. buchneri]|uniref:Uncharacterized protein n=1 Tax=Rickettsia tamurae subsp. buchneri TaxID=1462938 RepID=A0A8E1BZA3_9RICK|nr:hypothetical protein REISMN_08340 [Rickettsia tamurae subsp. buchneri]
MVSISVLVSLHSTATALENHALSISSPNSSIKPCLIVCHAVFDGIALNDTPSGILEKIGVLDTLTRSFIFIFFL